MSTSTGFDAAGGVRPGTVIERVYFTVPAYGFIDAGFDTMTEALAAAIDKADAEADRMASHYGAGSASAEAAIARDINVDVRWRMAYLGAAGGTVVDVVAQRVTHAGLPAAREALARHRAMTATLGVRP